MSKRSELDGGQNFKPIKACGNTAVKLMAVTGHWSPVTGHSFR